MEDNKDINTELINEALMRFGMAGADWELIRHNENITCKVTSEAKTYVLRIRKPQKGFATELIVGDISDVELMQSEAELLIHMHNNGFLGLQQPIKSIDGENIVILKENTPAMMLTWVDGRTLTEGEAGSYAEEFGEMALKIFRFSKGFCAKRPQYDDEKTLSLVDEINAALDDEHISKQVAEACIKEIITIAKRQAELKKEGAFGLIHADLTVGNILCTDNGLIPIDFSLSGFGPLAQDVGMLISNINDADDKQKVLDSINKAGESVSKRDAELFLSLGVLIFICAQHTRYYKEEWFQNALIRWKDTLFTHGED